jgi:hypothetical protein
MKHAGAENRAKPDSARAWPRRYARALKYRVGRSHRGAAQIGFSDIIAIAIVLAILLFAAWEQFPAYNRAFRPKPVLSPLARHLAPHAASTPAPQSTSQR